MAGKIYQDIDAVAADLFGKFFIVQSDRAVPVIGECAEPLGDRVRCRDFRIAMEFDRGTVMCRQKWLREQGNRMLTEVRRDVADAQSPLRRAIEFKTGMRGQQRHGMLPVPAPKLGENVFRRQLRAVIEAEQDVAMRQRKVGPQYQRVAQRGLRFGEPALTHQCQTEIVVPIGICWVGGDSVTGGFLRLARMARQ